MIDPHRTHERPDPDDLASVLSRVDAMLSRLERGIPAASQPAATRTTSRPASVVTPAVTPTVTRPTSDFSYEGFDEIAGTASSPAPRPLPRPVPVGPTVDFVAGPRVSYESTSLTPRRESRQWLWTVAALGLSAVAVASWWSALQHVANDRVRPLGPDELAKLVR